MRRVLPHFALALLCVACGCASSHSAALPSEILHLDPWTFDGAQGSTVLTKHYVIYTTIADDRWLDAFARLMEAALAAYSRLTPGVQLTQRPMECFVFASRRQWEAFTREKTGADAAIYLHITRGGYTVRNWFVAFNIGEAGTFSVAAHEGFHQFAAQHFKTRIPPFLEEGIACMFENVQWDRGVPTWKLEENPNRLLSLHTAVDAGQFIPLSELITLHAGQVVNGPKARIPLFYGESWAFAQFLWAGKEKKYRTSLQRVMKDAAAGRLEGFTPHPTDAVFWNPASAKPLLERYLGVDLKTLDAEFHAYVSRLLDAVTDSE